MKDMDKCIKEEFDFAKRATIYNNMEIALKAYNKLLIEYRDLFKFEKSTTAKGHLRTLFIEKQFSDSSFTPKAHYFVNMKEVNKYHHKALFIETEEFILNIARTMKTPMLPSISNYKKEYAKNNGEYDAQYQLNIDENDKRSDNIVLPKKYAFLTYGIQKEQLSHLGIVMPSYDFKGYIGYMDLTKDAMLLRNYIPEETREESIVSLKDGVLKEYIAK